MDNQSVTIKFAWRLRELAGASGLSVSFLRKEIRQGRLRAKRAGAAVLVLDSDFRNYLEGSADDDKSAGQNQKE